MSPALARPGGNVTGLSVLFTQLTPKLLSFKSEIGPEVRIVGLIVRTGGLGLRSRALCKNSIFKRLHERPQMLDEVLRMDIAT